MEQGLPQVVAALEREQRLEKPPKTPRRVRSRQDKENIHVNVKDTPDSMTANTDKFDEVYTPRMLCKDGASAMLSPSERSLAVPNQQKQSASGSAKRSVAARTRAILDALPIKHAPKTPSDKIRSPSTGPWAAQTPTSGQQSPGIAPPFSMHHSAPTFGTARFSPANETSRSLPSIKPASIEPVAIPRATILDQSVSDFPLRKLKPTLSRERIIRPQEPGQSLKRPPTPSSPYTSCSSERSSLYSSSAEELGTYIEPDETVEPREDIDPLVQHFREHYAYSPPLQFVTSAPTPMPEQPHLLVVPSRPTLAGFDIDKSCECNYLY